MANRNVGKEIPMGGMVAVMMNLNSPNTSDALFGNKHPPTPHTRLLHSCLFLGAPSVVLTCIGPVSVSVLHEERFRLCWPLKMHHHHHHHSLSGFNFPTKSSKQSLPLASFLGDLKFSTSQHKHTSRPCNIPTHGHSRARDPLLLVLISPNLFISLLVVFAYLLVLLSVLLCHT